MFEFLTAQIQNVVEYVNKECQDDQWYYAPLHTVTNTWSNMDLRSEDDRIAFCASVELARWLYHENREKFCYVEAYMTLLLNTGMMVSATIIEIRGNEG